MTEPRVLLRHILKITAGLLLWTGLCGFTPLGGDGPQILELKAGRSAVVAIPHPVKFLEVVNKGVADVSALSANQLYVYGKEIGTARLLLRDEENGPVRTVIEVLVTLDCTALKQKIHELYPEQKIKVYSSATGILLSGVVSGPEIIEQVLRLAATYLPQPDEGVENNETQKASETGKSGQELRITNLMKVGGVQQVMLAVKFAEVTRNNDKEWQAGLQVDKLLGHDVLFSAGVEGAQAAVPETLLLNLAGLGENVFVKLDNVTTALELLEEEGLARLLAEPKLVTQSGQEASFLAGGSFPVRVAQGDDTYTTEYKDFGVGLVFTPIVLSDGNIRLRVAPTVSDITRYIEAGPMLAERRLESTVNLYDGQTLALAGLLQNNLRETVRKIPGLGDIPILGALFRSSSYQQQKTDLLITVTPHLVKPVPDGEIELPGQHMREPDWFEFYLEGRLEGRRPAPDSGAAGPEAGSGGGEKGGFEGDFGPQ